MRVFVLRDTDHPGVMKVGLSSQHLEPVVGCIDRLGITDHRQCTDVLRAAESSSSSSSSSHIGASGGYDLWVESDRSQNTDHRPFNVVEE